MWVEHWPLRSRSGANDGEVRLSGRHVLRECLTELKRLVIQGFKSAFLPYRHRKDLLVEVAAKLDAMGGVPVSQVG